MIHYAHSWFLVWNIEKQYTECGVSIETQENNQNFIELLKTSFDAQGYRDTSYKSLVKKSKLMKIQAARTVYK